MSNPFSERVLALAGLAQALHQVRRIAETGHSEAGVVQTALDSVFRIDAVDAAGVFGRVSELNPGLRRPGQGQDAFGKGVAQAACSAILRSRGASVAAMTAPPRQMSPSYSTTDWPGVTARCGRANATSSRPSPATVTEQGSSTCR